MLMACANSLLLFAGASTPSGMCDEVLGVERFGSRLKTSWRLPRMAWLTGSVPARTFSRYLPMSRNRRCRPCSDCNCEVIRVERVPTATSLMSRRRCSTPISSASSASIIDGV
jgi:hypothetical protein